MSGRCGRAFPSSSPRFSKPLVYLGQRRDLTEARGGPGSQSDYYEHLNSNIHRGTHHLAQEATEAHETARQTIANHLNASSTEEIIFTSGTTDGINLISSVLGYSGKIEAGDIIAISNLEHHSNTVPWQMLCERAGAIPSDPSHGRRRHRL